MGQQRSDLIARTQPAGQSAEAGADEQVAVLAARLSAADMFELFQDQEGHTDQFRLARA